MHWTSLYSPQTWPHATDIWWPSLETCSNTFTWGLPTSTDIWWSPKHIRLASGKNTSSWNAFLLCCITRCFKMTVLKKHDIISFKGNPRKPWHIALDNSVPILILKLVDFKCAFWTFKQQLTFKIQVRYGISIVLLQTSLYCAFRNLGQQNYTQTCQVNSLFQSSADLVNRVEAQVGFNSRYWLHCQLLLLEFKGF